MEMKRTVWLIAALSGALLGPLEGQDTSAVRFTHDSIAVRFIETDVSLDHPAGL